MGVKAELQGWMDQQLGRQVVKVEEIVLLGLGLVLIGGGGLWMSKTREPVEVEIIEAEEGVGEMIWVDVSGAVEKQGVYQLELGSRVKDALLKAGGLSSEADRVYIARYINLAAKIEDGAKLYFPVQGMAGATGEVAGAASRVNLNTASVAALDGLWGIGEARAKAIVEARPFAKVEELAEVVPSNVYERIKDEVSVY